MYYIQRKPKLINQLTLPVGIFFLLLLTSCDSGEDKAYRQEIAAERMALNEHFFDPKESPLDSALFYTFKGLKFFPVKENYRVKASLQVLPKQEIFALPHSHDRSKPYRNYALAKFELDGKSYELMVLEQAEKKPGNENYLLLPFTDETNEKETYGGGRYIDLDKSVGTEVILDFNKAYNPYCAYNGNYTCPIPPKENHLPIAIEAGMKYESMHP